MKTPLMPRCEYTESSDDGTTELIFGEAAMNGMDASSSKQTTLRARKIRYGSVAPRRRNCAPPGRLNL